MVSDMILTGSNYSNERSRLESACTIYNSGPLAFPKKAHTLKYIAWLRLTFSSITDYYR